MIKLKSLRGASIMKTEQLKLLGNIIEFPKNKEFKKKRNTR